jgi:hypothetical protein
MSLFFCCVQSRAFLVGPQLAQRLPFKTRLQPLGVTPASAASAAALALVECQRQRQQQQQQ